MIAKSTVIKGRGGKFGGCAAKAVDLTLGEICDVSQRGAERSARVVTAAQKSAESIVATEVVKARTMEGNKDG